MIQAKHVTKKTTTTHHSKDGYIADAVARALMGQVCIRFMNGELIDISDIAEFSSFHIELHLSAGFNSGIGINSNGYHDDGSIWKVKNVFKKYYPGTTVISKIIVLTKTKKVWRQ